MDKVEIDRLKELRKAHLDRLHQLEINQAIHGSGTEPQIIIDIESAKNSIKYIESALGSAIEPETISELGTTGRFLALSSEIRLVDQRYRHQIQFLIEKTELKIEKIEQQQHAFARATHRWLTTLTVAMLVLIIIITIEVSWRF